MERKYLNIMQFTTDVRKIIGHMRKSQSGML